MFKDRPVILICTSADVIHIGVRTDFIVKPISTIFFFSAFGFCDYGDPEASLRAIRLLHSKELGDKALVVSERTEDFQKSIVYFRIKNMTKFFVCQRNMISPQNWCDLILYTYWCNGSRHYCFCCRFAPSCFSVSSYCFSLILSSLLLWRLRLMLKLRLTLMNTKLRRKKIIKR